MMIREAIAPLSVTGEGCGTCSSCSPLSWVPACAASLVVVTWASPARAGDSACVPLAVRIDAHEDKNASAKTAMVPAHALPKRCLQRPPLSIFSISFCFQHSRTWQGICPYPRSLCRLLPRYPVPTASCCRIRTEHPAREKGPGRNPFASTPAGRQLSAPVLRRNRRQSTGYLQRARIPLGSSQSAFDESPRTRPEAHCPGTFPLLAIATKWATSISLGQT